MAKMLFFALTFLAVHKVSVHEVPVSEFWGHDTVFLDLSDSVILQWFILPGDATFYWIRCFTGYTTNASRHFFTYIHNSGEHWTAEAFRNRTLLHSLQYETSAPIIFSLTLGNPVNDDSGVYTCELDGPGMSDSIMASLHLRVFLYRRNLTESDTRHVTSFGEVRFETKNTSDIVFDYANTTIIYGTVHEGYPPWFWPLLIIGSVAFAVFGVFVGMIIANKYPRASQRCLHRNNGDRKISTLQKEAYFTEVEHNNEVRCCLKDSLPVKEGVFIDI